MDASGNHSNRLNWLESAPIRRAELRSDSSTRPWPMHTQATARGGQYPLFSGLYSAPAAAGAGPKRYASGAMNGDVANGATRWPLIAAKVAHTTQPRYAIPNDEIMKGISQRISSNTPRQLSAVMCRYDLDSVIAATV